MNSNKNGKLKTILTISIMLLFLLTMSVFAGNGNSTIDGVIFELEGDYYEVTLGDWADAYYAGEGNLIYDMFKDAYIIGIKSGGRYIDFDDYALQYLNHGSIQAALEASKDLDQGIADEIKKYPPVGDFRAKDLGIEITQLIPGAYNVVIPFDNAANLLGVTSNDVIVLTINSDEIEMGYNESFEEFFKIGVQGFTEEQLKNAIVSKGIPGDDSEEEPGEEPDDDPGEEPGDNDEEETPLGQVAVTPNPNTLEMAVGDTEEIDYSTDPDGATVTFESSNTNVVSVDNGGNVTAQAEGFAIITLTGSLTDYEEGTATVDVNVEETEDESTGDLVWAEAGDETELDDALEAVENSVANAIRLTDNITLGDRYRIRAHWDFKALDMDGHTITLTDGPLAFKADGTKVENGTIVGDLTWWSWEGPGNPDSWDDGAWDDWQNSNRVMVSGDGVTFDGITFHADVADWYQTQEEKIASHLTIRNSALHGVSLFNGDVTLRGNDIYNRVGVEHDNAVLSVNTLLAAEEAVGTGHADVEGLYGIFYINSNALLHNNTWDDNFTGLFVGKSLKYYGDYSQAIPTLDGAVINTDKYGLVWWAINYEKAELNTRGEVTIISDRGGPGLMLVGTDYRDYGKTLQELEDNKEDGGAILGTATFTGADVWFGKPTVEFLEDHDQNYRGPYDTSGLADKEPVCVDKVDYQACKKDADRLLIDGPTFVSDVTIFTPANDYIGCVGDGNIENGVFLADPVWLGNVNFGYVSLWGDFDIVQGRAVEFDEIELKCGNIRRIGTDRDMGTKDECTEDHPSFTRRGRLVGGEITSDTKDKNVLVLGDGIRAINVDLTNFLYNVILETVYLDNVDINVGENPTSGDERKVCGYDLNAEGYDVFVWRGNHATFDGVTLSSSSTVEVEDLSMLTVVEGTFSNNGLVKVQKQGLVNFPPFDADIEISQTGKRAYVDFEVEAWENWQFNDWKPDIWIEAADDMYSKKYEFIFPKDGGKEYIVDLDNRDAPLLNGAQHPNAPFDVTEGIWLTDLLDIDRETLAAVVGESGLDFRLSLDKDRATDVSFQLDVEGWIFNCCDDGFEVAEDDREINLTGKFVQGLKPSIDCEVDEYGQILTVTGSVRNTTNFSITSDAEGWVEFRDADDIELEYSIELPIDNLRPGKTISWTFNIIISDLLDYGYEAEDLVDLHFWLETEDKAYDKICTVEVVDLVSFNVADVEIAQGEALEIDITSALANNGHPFTGTVDVDIDTDLLDEVDDPVTLYDVSIVGGEALGLEVLEETGTVIPAQTKELTAESRDATDTFEVEITQVFDEFSVNVPDEVPQGEKFTVTIDDAVDKVGDTYALGTETVTITITDENDVEVYNDTKDVDLSTLLQSFDLDGTYFDVFDTATQSAGDYTATVTINEATAIVSAEDTGTITQVPDNLGAADAEADQGDPLYVDFFDFQDRAGDDMEDSEYDIVVSDDLTGAEFTVSDVAFTDGEASDVEVLDGDGTAGISADTYTVIFSITVGGETVSDTAEITINQVPDVIEVEYQPKDTIAGEVIESDDNGHPAAKVTDKNGDPVVGLEVEVGIRGVGYVDVFDGGTTQVETNVDGIAIFDDLVLNEAGTYELAFRGVTNDLGTAYSNEFEIKPASVDPGQSGATWVDNENGTATMTVTVKDEFGNSIECLEDEVFEIRFRDAGFWEYMSDLHEDYWDYVDFTKKDDGVYEFVLTRNPDELPYDTDADVRVSGETIKEELDVIITDE